MGQQGLDVSVTRFTEKAGEVEVQFGPEVKQKVRLGPGSEVTPRDRTRKTRSVSAKV